MALPTLHWKKITYATGGVTTLPDLLDAIYTALQSATYHDASSRTPGSGSAWTVSRYQNGGTTEAVYATPPSAAVSGLRVILAGVNSGVYTPTVVAPSTWTTSRLYAGINRNSGAYNAWDNAAPFTSGNFTGFMRFAEMSAVTINYVVIYESEEALFVSLVRSDNQVVFALFGAYVDPLSTDVLDEEQTHQRIFGMTCSHDSGGLFSHSTAYLFNHLGGATTAKHHIWFPNAALGTTVNVVYWSTSPSANHYKLPSGGYLTAPMVLYNTATNKCIGVVRNIYWCTDATHGVTLTASSVEKGHFLSGSFTTDGDAAIFRSN